MSRLKRLLVLSVLGVTSFFFWGNYGRSSTHSLQQHVKDARDSNHHRHRYTCGSTGNRTYATVYRYKGQQGAGVRSIASFQCFLASLGLSVVFPEPNIDTKENHLWGHKMTNAIRIGTMFDIDIFNSRSKELGRPEMISMDEFDHCRPKKTIFVNITLERVKREVLWTSEQKGSHASCLTNKLIEKHGLINKDHSRGKKLTMTLKQLKRESCIVRVVELPVQLPRGKRGLRIDTKSAVDFIFDSWSPSEVAVEFNQWAGPYFVPSSHGNDCYREFNMSKIINYLFKPSKKLIKDAKRYEEKFLGGENRLAIMLRAERVAKDYFLERKDLTLSREGVVTDCFNKVLDLSKQIIKNSTAMSIKPLVTLDIGSFGSSSVFQLSDVKGMLNISEKALMALYHNQWTIEDWESSFVQIVGRTPYRGYVAALQRTLASRADCLVLMGGGNFQALAVKDYLDNHKKQSERCIHLVCMPAQANLVPRLFHNNG